MSIPPVLPSTANGSAKPVPTLTKRLIVLVPSHDIYEALLARHVWTTALKSRSDVLYVALARDPDEEINVRRSLAVLAAMTRDSRLQVTTQLAVRAQWLKVLHSIYQPGDAIVCLAEQTIRRLGRLAQPLGEVLAAEFDGNVLVLDGISVEQQAQPRRTLWPMLREAVPFVIAAVFLELQMLATAQLGQTAARTMLLALSVVVEFSVIWLWVSRVQ